MAGPRAERSLVAAAVLAVAATVGGACVDADVVSIDSGKALPTSSTVVEDEDVLPIGSSIETARGNTVGVLDAAASESGVHTLIEACAARGSTEDVGVSLSFFTVQLQDGTTVAPTDPRDAREPALRTQQIEAGTCTVGWLSFDVHGEQDTAQALVFGSKSSGTRWDLREVG